MRSKKTKGKSGITLTNEGTSDFIQGGSGPIALRTRASSKSPHKRPTATSLQQARAIANKRKGKQPLRGALSMMQEASQPSNRTSHSPQADNSSPGDQSRRVGVIRIIPDGLISYSQRRSENDYDVDTNGNVIDGPSHHQSPHNESPEFRRPDVTQGGANSDEGDELLDEDDDDDIERNSVDFPWSGNNGDAELFQDNTDGNIVDITPIARAARIFEMAGITINSPLASLSRRDATLEGQGRATSEAHVSAAVDSAFDILEQHRARRKRPPPLPNTLAEVARRVNPQTKASTSRAAAQLPTHSSLMRAAATGFLSGDPQSSLRNTGNTVHSNNAIPQNGAAAVAELARLPAQGARPEEDEGNDGPPGNDQMRRRRSGNPAPHQILWHTPHSREFHRWAKVDYSFKIATENAYPSAQERLLMARAAYDSAVSALPELADNSSGVQWSIEKMRLYTDTAWVRRGVIKACASNIVFGTYRLGLTPAIAAQMPGGGTQANQVAFTSERVSYLFTDGHWLRGRLNGVHVKTTSMLYAHTIFADIIEETIYRPATAPQRAKLCPMPIPALALVATAVQCALEEYASGYRKRIPFTEESYRRVYSLHLKRLNRTMTTHRHHTTELLQTLYEHCVTRNEPLPNQNPREEEEFDDLDVLLSDLGASDYEDSNDLDGFEVIGA